MGGFLELDMDQASIDADVNFSTEAIALAHGFVAAPAKDGRRVISALFLARAAQALHSCEILCKHGATGDAMSVARTVVELDIEHAYIVESDDDLDERWQRYVAYEAKRRDDLVKAIAVLHEGRFDKDVIAHSDRAAAEAKKLLGKGRDWAGVDADGNNITLKTRALATKRRDQYNLAYVEMCGASHGGFSTLRYVMPSQPKEPPFPILISFGKPNTRPLSLGIGSMIPLLATAAVRAKDIPLQAKVDDMNRRMRKFYEARNLDGERPTQPE
jgi:hypothetical protein